MFDRYVSHVQHPGDIVQVRGSGLVVTGPVKNIRRVADIVIACGELCPTHLQRNRRLSRP